MKNKEKMVEFKIDLSGVPNAFDIIMSAVRDELNRGTKSLDEPEDLADQAKKRAQYRPSKNQTNSE